MATKKKTPAKAPEKPTAKFKTVVAYPTEVGIIDYGDLAEIEVFNQDLLKRLYHMRSDSPDGIYRSNTGGTYHSTDTVFKDCGAVGVELQKMFASAYKAYAERFWAIKPGGEYHLSISGWAMMTRDGGYASPHTHPNCQLAGVYYVDDGSPAEARRLPTGNSVVPGTLEILDTRMGVGAFAYPGLRTNPTVRVPCRAGRMVIFPSGTPHWVHPFEGEGERVAVAANCSIVKYNPPKENK